MDLSKKFFTVEEIVLVNLVPNLEPLDPSMGREVH